MTSTSGIYTRIELGAYGYTGAICRDIGRGLTQGRFVTAYGSRRTVRRALKAALRHSQRLQA